MSASYVIETTEWLGSLPPPPPRVNTLRTGRRKRGASRLHAVPLGSNRALCGGTTRVADDEFEPADRRACEYCATVALTGEAPEPAPPERAMAKGRNETIDQYRRHRGAFPHHR